MSPLVDAMGAVTHLIVVSIFRDYQEPLASVPGTLSGTSAQGLLGSAASGVLDDAAASVPLPAASCRGAAMCSSTTNTAPAAEVVAEAAAPEPRERAAISTER